MTVTNNIEGLALLTKQLRLLKVSTQGKFLRASVKAAIAPVLARARAAIPVGVDKHRTYLGRPVKPGFAKKSIRVVISVSRDKSSATARLGVKAEAFYAVQFVELGTSKQRKQAWLRPAFRAEESQQVATVGATLRQSIAAAAANAR